MGPGLVCKDGAGDSGEGVEPSTVGSGGNVFVVGVGG
jgi:hypothetical protein